VTDARPTYTNPDPTAQQVSVDPATGNPIWQLIDKGGSVLRWAVDKTGSVVGLENLGTTANDARPSYQAPANAKRSGTDAATGNPLYQLLDEGGDLIEWGIDWLGNVVGVKNLGKPLAPSINTKPAAKTGADAGALTKQLNTGDPAKDILSQLLNGENKDNLSGGLKIVNQTDNRPVTTYNVDNSVRTSSNTTTNVSTNVNSADLVSKVVDSIAGIFKASGGNSPIQSASAVTPSDDTIFGRASFPGDFAKGRPLDGARMEPGSNAQPKPAVATLTGNLSSTLTNENNRPLLLLGIALSAAALLVVIFRRRA
jgi:hypothetical protein